MFRAIHGETTKFALPAIAILACMGIAQACNVPVFRFALERWRPAPYRVTLLHRGSLPEAQRALLGTLEDHQDKSTLNVAVRTLDATDFDVNSVDDADRELFASLAETPLPTLLVQYPAYLGIAAPIWSGPLNSDSVRSLTESPIRQELVRRLAEGQTAVWLLLEGGQTDKDDAAAMLIEEQLRQLEHDLKLPELTDSSEDTLLSATPLQLAFSLLRVPRGDAEQPLIQMLLHSESDLAERSDPMVFPIFGRGRALLPLIGAGITAENIHDSAAFLVGACSCEVKEQNPGFDLLLAADWDDLLSQDGVPLIAAGTRGSLPDGEAELIPIPSGSLKTDSASSTDSSHPEVSSNGGVNRSLLLIGGVVAACTVVIAFWSVAAKRR